MTDISELHCLKSEEEKSKHTLPMYCEKEGLLPDPTGWEVCIRKIMDISERHCFISDEDTKAGL